jgi:hypothetical protein
VFLYAAGAVRDIYCVSLIYACFLEKMILYTAIYLLK